jgi:hypothetical protein
MSRYVPRNAWQSTDPGAMLPAARQIRQFRLVRSDGTDQMLHSEPMLQEFTLADPTDRVPATQSPLWRDMRRMQPPSLPAEPLPTLEDEHPWLWGVYAAIVLASMLFFTLTSSGG